MSVEPYIWADGVAQSVSSVKLVTCPLCPDLLEHRDLGEADNARGRVVRAFFWLMRWWPT